mmetsp:Transcript_3669/g.10557  ORF Transcript_3669/g.10557 Transcript_3669/m.10557 type:complete len:96 (+) Transcript_3669:104-391(+)
MNSSSSSSFMGSLFLSAAGATLSAWEAMALVSRTGLTCPHCLYDLPIYMQVANLAPMVVEERGQWSMVSRNKGNEGGKGEKGGRNRQQSTDEPQA